MSRRGEAVAHGAATIINAIATGKGSAFGVDLWTKARVRLTEEVGVIDGKILSDPSENPILITETVLVVLRYFKAQNTFGAIVETESNIPIARGMKSSSAASNALVLATAASLGKTLDHLTAINLGIDAAIQAKTTVTGAFDDACASYFGNIVVTDNLERKILRRFKAKQNLHVLFQVPPAKTYTYKSDVERMRLIAPQTEVAFEQALYGNYWTSLTLNGFLYSAILGYNHDTAIDALKAGAIASGLSGTGPATVAVALKERVDDITDAWEKYEGSIIKTRINRMIAQAGEVSNEYND